MTPHQERLLSRLGAAVGRLGTHSLPDMIQAAKEGTAQLWEGEGVVLLTDVFDYPRLRALRYLALGGQLGAETDLQARVDAWGREQGCVRAEALVRKGWERVAVDRAGWRRAGGFWTKEI